MRGTCLLLPLAWLLACSAAETDTNAPPPTAAQGDQSAAPSAPGNQSDGAAADADRDVDAPEVTVVEALNPTLVVFTDPDTGFMTGDVYDATRDIVRFDAALAAMVFAATGDTVSNWTTDGNDLGPFGAFRVRFGSEGGERRAYFTETGNATICNLVLSGPDMLDIYPTSERPPMN